MKVNEHLKNLLKLRRFKWKTLQNEANGQRVEILEGVNLEHKEQLNPDTAFFYRRNLNKENLFKDTLSFEIENTIELSEENKPIAGSNSDFTSMSLILGDLIHMSQQTGIKLSATFLDQEDRFTSIREKLTDAEMKKLITSEVAVTNKGEGRKVSVLNLMFQYTQSIFKTSARFGAVDVSEMQIKKDWFQYARIRESPILVFKGNNLFSKVVIVQSQDLAMNIIILVKKDKNVSKKLFENVAMTLKVRTLPNC